MSITQRSEAPKQRQLIPAGNHLARCFSLVDIGTIEETFKDETNWHQKIRIGWELPLEKRIFDEAKGEQPLAHYEEYTFSMGKKANLRKIAESWRGQPFESDEQAYKFDSIKLLGQPCMLNLIHRTSAKGNQYVQVTAVTPIPKGFSVPEQINPSHIFSFDKWTEEGFNKLPDFVREKIKGSLEYKKMFEGGTKNDDRDLVSSKPVPVAQINMNEIDPASIIDSLPF